MTLATFSADNLEASHMFWVFVSTAGAALTASIIVARQSSETAFRRFWREATTEQARDSGMALVLVFLLLWLYERVDGFITAAVITHVVNMSVPQVFRPFAVIWFRLSHILGTVVSKVILAIIFFGVVTPIGVWRRIASNDALNLRAFKAGAGSVMKERNHTFVGRDLEGPY